METQDCNSSDIRPEVEVGSANASNNFSPDLIEDFNDIPSNQDDFDQSTIDPSACPSKKIRSKVWDYLIKIRAENLNDQKAQCKYCNAILGADPAKGTSCLKNHIDRCKKYPANIELAQRKLALQARFSIDGSKLMMEGKGSSLQACCSVIAAANPITDFQYEHVELWNRCHGCVGRVDYMLASNGKLVDSCLEMLVNNFTPPYSFLQVLNQPRGVAKKDQVLGRVHSALEDIAALVPLALSSLLSIIIHKMPNVFPKEAVEIGWNDILSEDPPKGILEMELEDEETLAGGCCSERRA
ncbi:hypothetical protein Ancab_018592 [Ancistrocladus abbreviatus]